MKNISSIKIAAEHISDMQLFEVECIIFPDIYTPLLRMDIS